MWPVFAFLFGFSWHSGMLLFSYNYFFQKRLIYFCFMYMCESLTLSLSSMCLLCLQTTEEGLGTWSCSYRQLWSAEWMQWREPQSTVRAVSICNAWTISLVPCAVILYLVSMLNLPITFYSIYLFCICWDFFLPICIGVVSIQIVFIFITHFSLSSDAHCHSNEYSHY